MRILFLTSFYPPHHIGGWGQLVEEINKGLQARGHVTQVLATNHGVDGVAKEESGVLRLLHPEADLYHYNPRQSFLNRHQRTEYNLQVARQTLAEFQPDVVFIHVMFNLSPQIAWHFEQALPGRVVYYIADDWPHAPDVHQRYWRSPAQKPVLGWVKKRLGHLPLRILDRERRAHWPHFRRVLCVSQAVRKDLAENAGIPLDRSTVIYNGIDLAQFPMRSFALTDQPRSGLSLLYAGSLVPHKGVHTAIEGLYILANEYGLAGIRLTILGSGHPQYEQRLRRMVTSRGLSEKVAFKAGVPREQMPAELDKHDVLLFPSIWEEPLARMTQEAMASGLVVVGTPTGGTAEILRHGETGLTFPPEDPTGLADRVRTLWEEPGLRKGLAHNARSLVEREFDIQRTVAEVEHALASQLARSFETTADPLIQDSLI